MSLSASCSAPTARKSSIETPVLLGVIWLAIFGTSLFAGYGRGDALSTDDAMRLVEVRDFLVGQSWFDLTQHRLSPPDGVVMHWSRLIDLPLAMLVRAGEIVLPAALAERVATIVWPAALLLFFLAGVARAARELAGDAAARLALFFAALIAPVLQHFRPGAIDHHNVQLVLLVWSLALTCRAPLRARDAAGAGMLSALSLAIGVEMVPAIAALAAVIALRWIVRAETGTTVAFGLAFAAATFSLFAATVAPARYGVVACDALSIVHVAAAGIGGAGLAALAAARGMASPWTRLAGAGALAALLAATLYLAFPACLGDPYAHLDPRLNTLWLSNVNEARSVIAMLRDLPQEVLPYYGLAAAGLALGAMQAVRQRDDGRWSWIAGLAVLAALFAVALWQVRVGAAANAVAAAILPAALASAFPTASGREVFLGLGRAALIAALLLNPLALIAIGAASARAVETAAGTRRPVVLSDGPGTCRQAADYARFAHLPKGVVLGFIDAGPFILMETPHATLAAPYHRNVKGNTAMLDIFLGPAGEAASRLAALGIDYIAFCPGSPERYNYAAAAPDGLAAALARGDAPGFLERVPLDGTDLALYRARH